MMKRLTTASCILSLVLTGCANLGTVSRTTRLPGQNLGTGKAIHLDAEQRLVFVNDLGRVCAEPSPDALTAFAAALGGGVSIPSQGAGSVSGAITEAAGSIGLRTQSISLLRDALYRVCEAYYNGQVSRPQVMLLLSRSQDLTAAIVAIEQLTGAVVANQVGLGGNSGANASATLLANKKLVEVLREQKLANENDLKDSEKKLTDMTAARDTTKSDIKGLEAQKKSNPPPDAATIQLIDRQLGEKQAALQLQESELAKQEALVNTKKENLKTTDGTLRSAETSLDSAIAATTASAAGNTSFSSASTAVRLNDASTGKIADAVRGIIDRVFEKKYIVETCVALLTNPPEEKAELTASQKTSLSSSYNKLADACVGILRDVALKPDSCNEDPCRKPN